VPGVGGRLHNSIISTIFLKTEDLRQTIEADAGSGEPLNIRPAAFGADDRVPRRRRGSKAKDDDSAMEWEEGDIEEFDGEHLSVEDEDGEELLEMD
jgi:hypothetical protein